MLTEEQKLLIVINHELSGITAELKELGQVDQAQRLQNLQDITTKILDLGPNAKTIDTDDLTLIEKQVINLLKHSPKYGPLAQLVRASDS